MYRPLSPCPSCSRHVLTTEPTCPFCKSTLSAAETAAPIVPRGLSRAAMLPLGATLALQGCSGGTTTVGGGDASADGSSGSSSGSSGTSGTSGGPGDDGGQQALYGAIPVD